jgi:hypothetical protein
MKTKTEDKYEAHIALKQEGKDIFMYFNNLTLSQAKALHRLMQDNYSHVYSSAEVKNYGWEVTK